MKDILDYLYNGIFRFKPVSKYFRMKSHHLGIFPRVGFLDDKSKHELERLLGVSIRRPEFFEQALIHRSYLQVLDNSKCLSNERLEFLGDAILGMFVAEYLFSLHTNVLEGDLTKMRSWLVNRSSLSLCAKRLELDKFIKLSYSAEKSLIGGSDSILADALEAVIAAIYLDSGAEIANKFILNTLLPIIMNKNQMVDTNFKSILLESVQANGKHSPVYSVLDELGPDHDKEFIVGVYVEGVLLGTGKGKSKKQAEQIAAKSALESLNAASDEQNIENN